MLGRNTSSNPSKLVKLFQKLWRSFPGSSLSPVRTEFPVHKNGNRPPNQEESMKRTFFAAGLFAVLASTSFGQQLVARVPFSFQLGKTSMPAGKYLISESGSVTKVQSASGKPTVMTLTRPASRHSESTTPSLEFQRYGHEYFLTNIWTGDSQTGHALPKGEREKELARNLTSAKTEEVALGNTNKPEGTLQAKNALRKELR
jgi:hypothetical protein